MNTRRAPQLQRRSALLPAAGQASSNFNRLRHLGTAVLQAGACFGKQQVGRTGEVLREGVHLLQNACLMSVFVLRL